MPQVIFVMLVVCTEKRYYCANANWLTGHYFNTVFIVLEDADAQSMHGMLLAHVLLFFFIQ